MLQEIDDIEALAYTYVVEAQTLLAKADDTRAKKRADEALELALSAGAALRTAEARICRGYAMGRLGEGGRPDIETGLASAREAGLFRVVLYGLLALGEAYANEGDLANAGIAFEDGIRQSSRAGYRRAQQLLEETRERLGLLRASAG